MAARSIGSGTISFGLVSIPFKLYTATSAKSVSFNMLHAKCGSRMKQQYLCPVDNEIVDRKDMVKGFEHQRDSFVRFTEDELKSLEAARTNSLDLVEFVPLDTVDFLYVEKSYYLGPDKGGERAYRLLSESLQRTGRVAVGRYATRGKDNLVIVRPYKKGLVLHEVYYADEVRAFDEVETGGAFEFKQVEVELAEKLIAELAVAKFSPEKFKDEYAERVMAAVEKKVAGEEFVAQPEAPKAQIIDLLEALKRSVASVKKADNDAAAPPAEAPAAAEAPPPSESPGPKKAEPREKKSKKKAVV
ncbi:MAG: Ku protein [Myxococcales bacterium]|jgi:DNA end-binding protein Ku|nr:Ku protein [Myxococcales bacterium]